MKTLELFTREQDSAVEFLQSRTAGILWGDVGTGKTPVALTVLKGLLDRFDCGRILVIGPQRVARRVWSTEVTEWAHLTGLRVVRLTGIPTQRLAALDAPADIYTITRDLVPWLEAQFIRATPDAKGRVKREQYRRWPWDTVILDESQSFKHQDTKRFRSMRRLRRLASRIYLLSGSLMPNGYKDLWAQLYLVDGGTRLGLTETAFLNRWFSREVNDGVVTYTLKEGAKAEIDKRIADVVYVLKDTRPEHVRSEFHAVQLSKAEMQAYRKMVRTSVLSIGGKQITAVNAGVLYGKLLQIANGAVYDETKAWHEVHTQLIDGLVELLESLPRPVIVGYGFRHDVERIQKALGAGGDRVALLRSDASLDAWRAGQIDIGIMHPASAGHGLNDLYVAGGENLVWFGFTSNREFYDQLNGRIAGGHRRAGKNIVIHHMMVEGTIHERARALLEYKGEEQLAAQMNLMKEMVRGTQTG